VSDTLELEGKRDLEGADVAYFMNATDDPGSEGYSQLLPVAAADAAGANSVTIFPCGIYSPANAKTMETMEEGDENNIEGIDFEITPRVVQGGENVNFNLYSDDGQQLQVSDAKLNISKNGDPVETEESVSLPQSDKLTSESVSEIDWFIEDGNYSFEVSITNNDRELSAEDSLTILVNDGDDNNSNPINEMDLNLNKQEFKIGEQFKIFFSVTVRNMKKLIFWVQF
jgi:hypothetical protein